MTSYRPSARTQILTLASFLAMVLPAISVAGMGYLSFLEKRLNLDMDAHLEGVVDHLLMLAAVIPMIPIMLTAIVLAGILWMVFIARCLSWPDIRFYTRQKGRHVPVLSDCLQRIWLQIVLSRSKAARAKGLRR